MLQSKYNNKNNTIFMAFDTIEINLVGSCCFRPRLWCSRVAACHSDYSPSYEEILPTPGG